MSLLPPHSFLHRLALLEEIERLEIALATAKLFHVQKNAFNDEALAVQNKIRLRIQEKREELKRLGEK